MTLAEDLEQDGFAIARRAADKEMLDRLRKAFDEPIADGTGGIRNVLRDFPAARLAANSPELRRLVTPFLSDDCLAVRGILFDKTADGANWKVPYHQDLSIAVSHRLLDSPAGWGPWTEKAGVTHVQPPTALLARMLTLRLHLNPCTHENGPLRVLPGSHRSERLTAAEIAQFRSSTSEVVCTIAAGDAILMRPLLHASSPATQPNTRRRVLHIEYAAADIRLPEGLDWHERVSH